MAKIVIFGAAGKAGSRIVAEAARRGHQVLAVARAVNALQATPPGVRVAPGDATSTSSVAALAPNTDVLVVAVGGPDKSVYANAARAVVAAVGPLGPAGPRIIHLGGGGSLLNADGVPIVDTLSAKPELVAEMRGQAAALAAYRASTGVRWTYISPPPGGFAPGERQGHYRTGLEHPVAAADGSMGLSYEDFAMALVDEIEQPRFIDMRFTVGY